MTWNWKRWPWSDPTLDVLREAIAKAEENLRRLDAIDARKFADEIAPEVFRRAKEADIERGG